MKNLISIIICLITFSFITQAQNTLSELPKIKDKVVYDTVASIPNSAANVIAGAAATTMKIGLNDLNLKLQTADLLLGQVTSSGSFLMENFHAYFDVPNNTTVTFMIKIDCKTSRYRISLSNFKIGGFPIEGYDYELKTCDIRSILQDAWLLDVRIRSTMAAISNSINKQLVTDF